jgi:hypothetical protein
VLVGVLVGVLRWVFEGLAAFGGLYLYAPMLIPGDWAATHLPEYSARSKHAPLSGPAERHPERLRPDVPLTTSELWFRMQMQHLDPLLPVDNG